MTVDRDLLDRLDPPAVSDADVRRLRVGLARRAAGAGLVDVAWRHFDSPLGRLTLAATERGLVRVAFADEGDVLDLLAREVSPRVLHEPDRLDPVARALDDYFAGRPMAEVDLDLRLAHGFRREVLDQLRTIPHGQTRSYAEVAAAAGSPRAVRAVGTACALNPVPVVVPCHRVVRSDGTPGAYRGGTTAKRTLLALEHVG
ncbi:methylated-DNA--[protein]-cysteine S-methyltransferase [Mariniluteicoccus endophyticus]